MCLVTIPFAKADDDPLPEDLPPANEGAFEGGETGTFTDPGTNNVVPDDEQRTGGKFDIPTGAPPSPLQFGDGPLVESFTQQMLRFEEFGTEPLPDDYTVGVSFPAPEDAQSHPDGAALDAFLSQAIYPAPMELSNDGVWNLDSVGWNPWKAEIEAFLGYGLEHPPAEGRPPGEGWAHQRWDEFPPEVYFQTAQAGSRRNNGLRDSKQSHGYSVGEFAHDTSPGPDGDFDTFEDNLFGLYHNSVHFAYYDDDDYEFWDPWDATCGGIDIRFHPNMPIQHPDALWTFDGTLPPKLLRVRYGQTVLMRHYNALPIDPAANYGFGLHTITTHEHNGHTPAESDGFTQAFFFPGQYYDYRWPLILAGHDTVNKNASNPKAGTPDGDGGIINLKGDYRETMSTHWFHDHMLDFTAQNVYKGNAVMMNYYSSIDRGNEAINDGINLRFPSGTALDWGNRDYDVNLLIADKAWDDEGQLFFNIFNLEGFLGDHLLTNWLYHPYFNVRARKYRFRILNGSVSRYIKLALVEQVNDDTGAIPGPPGSGISYNKVNFWMIANDGNIMEHAVAFNGTKGTRYGILPTQAIAERYDIIVDFSKFEDGAKLYFVNLLEHEDGRRPNKWIGLRRILSGRYSPVAEDKDGDGAPDRWEGGDPCVGKFLEIRVHEYDLDGDGVPDEDPSMNPARYVAGRKTMIPLPKLHKKELANALHRTFEFGRSSGTDQAPWTIKTDGGSGFPMDPRRLSAAPNLDELTEKDLGHLEIWHIENGGGGWSHPVHIHFEEGRILKRDGEDPPEWEKWARKDMYRIGRMPDSGDSVEVALRFREFAGSYMEHCHNTQHEDHAMLLRYDIENPGQFSLMLTPMPTWDGVGYVASGALPTFRTGDED